MFHFSIRDVLWLTVVVGAFVAWYADRRKLNDAYNRVKEEREWAFELGKGLVYTMRLDGYEIDGPSWRERTKVRIMAKPKPKKDANQRASPDEN